MFMFMGWDLRAPGQAGAACLPLPAPQLGSIDKDELAKGPSGGEAARLAHGRTCRRRCRMQKAACEADHEVAAGGLGARRRAERASGKTDRGSFKLRLAKLAQRGQHDPAQRRLELQGTAKRVAALILAAAQALAQRRQGRSP